jgi:transposase-like protein
MWFRAAWHVTSQKNGASAVSLQQVLGLGSYMTAWTWLHKLRRAMVRPGRDRLRGTVEVDETYWGGEEKGVVGRLTEDKALIAVAAEEDGKGIGRIRLRSIPDLTKASLHGFIAEAIEPGSTVRTDGLNSYLGMEGYAHERQVQRHQPEGEHLLPRAHRVVSLLKRWLLGTHQGAIGHAHLGLLPRRIHIPIQSPYLSLAGQVVLPPSATSRTSRSGTLQEHHRRKVRPQHVVVGGVN